MNTINLIIADDHPIFRQANGAFATTTQTVGTVPGEIVAGYFNGDGHLDFAVNHFGNNTPNPDVSLRLGRGDGTFSSLPALNFAASPFPLSLNDLNNDGKFDVVT
ncbi:MAG: hypothetical protein HOP19_04735, partial [Acidobacteria bacterium]|nr:hypothetical protein [Acidobacteriota bacterium]